MDRLASTLQRQWLSPQSPNQLRLFCFSLLYRRFLLFAIESGGGQSQHVRTELSAGGTLENAGHLQTSLAFYFLIFGPAFGPSTVSFLSAKRTNQELAGPNVKSWRLIYVWSGQTAGLPRLHYFCSHL